MVRWRDKPVCSPVCCSWWARRCRLAVPSGLCQLLVVLRHAAHAHPIPTCRAWGCRWRKLEGSDPTTYEMILKIQALQRRLITKTEEVVEKDLLIGEKEKLYLELKSILARQPGPEAAEQLSLYQASLREKTKQMKALASELNMYQAQVRAVGPLKVGGGGGKFKSWPCAALQRPPRGATHLLTSLLPYLHCCRR